MVEMESNGSQPQAERGLKGRGRGRMAAEAEERTMASCHADCKRRREFGDFEAFEKVVKGEDGNRADSKYLE